MKYETVEKILAAAGMQLVKTTEVVDGTTRNYKDDEGRSALVFTHDRRPVSERRKDPKSLPCPHCGRKDPESHEAWLDRKGGGRHEVILHYHDQAGKHQNVVKGLKDLPTPEQLTQMWDQNKKEGYRPMGDS